MTTFLMLQKRGTIALPPDVRDRYGLDLPGAQVEIIERDGEIVLRPHVPVPTDQAWFWADEWQQREQQAEADFRAGRVTIVDDVDALLDRLDTLE